MKQFIKFGVVGTAGFIVDASILLVCSSIFEFDIPSSRLISFLCAVFVTWILNRNFTFSKQEELKKKKEYTLYLIIQIIGALINYSIFITLINMEQFFKEYLIIPLAIASIVAMFFNFFISKKFIYKQI